MTVYHPESNVISDGFYLPKSAGISLPLTVIMGNNKTGARPFGGKEYAVRGVPANLFSIAKQDLLMEMLDNLSDDNLVSDPQIIL